MARKVSLTVNDNLIELDYFVEGYVYHVAAGILASLKGTGAVKNLELDVDNDGQIKITLNGSDVPLSYFPVQIMRSTLAGMVSNLKGVDKEMSTLELRISQ
ncbi:MAG: hypothetical protein A2Y58_00150 [Chloroflexi bacterium RBG_13_51_52]|nr:MAG: hypothetical protein A2Y58_00150 [Chloroflexi bacterium RBG_13_51_52]